MKKTNTRMTVNLAAVIAMSGLAVCARAQNLIGNGDFSFNPIGTTLTVSNSNPWEDTRFSYWGLYSVGSLNGTTLTATIVTNPASAANLALRLDYVQVGEKNWAGGEDTEFIKRSYMPVVVGRSYYISFDAAHISGGTQLLVIMPEFQASGAYSGNQYAKMVSVTSPEYQHYVIAWTPTRDVTTQAGISFQPQATGLGSDTNSSFLLDNVEIVEAGYGLNSGFEAQPLGTTATVSGAGWQGDNTTFSHWRLLTINASDGSYLRGTIVPNPASGGSALRLDYNLAEGGSVDWATLERETDGMTINPGASRVAVTANQGYLFSFDAAHISGSEQIQIVLAEFKSDHTWSQVEWGTVATVASTGMQRYAFHWKPLSDLTTEVNISFRLQGRPSTSLILDNVQLTPVSVYNGSFEATGAAPDAWWFYSDPKPGGIADDLTGTLVPNATDGYKALEVSWTSHDGRDCLFATANNPLVTYGVNYNIMFDAALVSGSPNLNLVLPNFTSGGGFVGQLGFNFMVTSADYQTFTIPNWTPSDPAAHHVYMGFRQRETSGSSSVIRMDNVRFGKTVSVELGNLSHTYDGWQKAATATTIPAGVPVRLTYNGLGSAPLNAGSYTVVGTVSDPMYLALGDVTNTLVIAKVPATVTLDNLTYRYDGTPKAATVGVTPAGLKVDVTYNGSSVAPTEVGKYTVVGTVNELNYAGSATNLFVITAIPRTMIILR